MKLKLKLKFAVLSVLFGLALNAHAAWPERPLKLIVPFPAGNSSDVAARVVGDRLAAKLGQSVIVENRAGVSGTLGTAYGAVQPADGYTLLIGAPGALSVAPWARAAPLAYDPVKDFVTVGAIAWAPQILVARKDAPFNTFNEFVAHANKPDVDMFYGSSGVGTVGHLITSQILSQSNIKATNVPYKGGSSVVTDLRGGVLHFSIETVPVVQGLLADGSLKAIGSSAATRVPSLPNVPTLKEQGLDIDTQGYILIVANAQTPAPIVKKLRETIKEIMEEPDISKKLSDLGLTKMNLPAEDLNNFIQNESSKWKSLVEMAGIEKSLN